MGGKTENSVKSALLITLVFSCTAAQLIAENTNRIVVNVDQGKGKISRHIYGHFSEHLGNCIYDGFWVGEDSTIPNTHGIRNDVVEALRELHIPNLRWPGGCFADEYHWMDGIGPRSERPSMVNTHWGGVTEDNSFGTHEFLDLCEQLGCEPYICGNIGSGTVKELSQWVEYVTSDAESPMTDLRKKNGREKPWKVRFWAIGNENWGCGGRMRPEYYRDVYRRYATYCRNYGDNRLYKVAGGPTANFPDDFFANYHWTEVMMRDETTRNSMDGLSLHFYTHLLHYYSLTNLIEKDISQSATEFNEKDWIAVLLESLKMDDILTRHSAIMDYYDPDKKIGLIVDEWGTWYQGEPGTNPGFLYQQNSLRDALVASTTLDIFNKHCERVTMANIAQTINVLQAMILTRDEQMVLTPSYHVFKMYRVHQDADLLPVDLECEHYSHGDDSIPAVSASASRDEEGKIHLSMSNLNPNKNIELACELRGVNAIKNINGEVLTADKINSYNDFGKTEEVSPASFRDFKVNRNTIYIKLPSKSVVMLEIM